MIIFCPTLRASVLDHIHARAPSISLSYLSLVFAFRQEGLIVEDNGFLPDGASGKKDIYFYPTAFAAGIVSGEGVVPKGYTVVEGENPNELEARQVAVTDAYAEIDGDEPGASSNQSPAGGTGAARPASIQLQAAAAAKMAAYNDSATIGEDRIVYNEIRGSQHATSHPNSGVNANGAGGVGRFSSGSAQLARNSIGYTMVNKLQQRTSVEYINDAYDIVGGVDMDPESTSSHVEGDYATPAAALEIDPEGTYALPGDHLRDSSRSLIAGPARTQKQTLRPTLRTGCQRDPGRVTRGSTHQWTRLQWLLCMMISSRSRSMHPILEEGHVISRPRRQPQEEEDEEDEEEEEERLPAANAVRVAVKWRE